MFKIQDGRDTFYQWDLNRKLIVEDKTVKYVHFCNKTKSESYVVQTRMEGNDLIAPVPNALLTTDWRICVYAYYDKYTKVMETFEVVARSKPANYAVEEEDIRDYNDILNSFDTVVDGLIGEFEELKTHVNEALLELGYAEDGVY